MESPNRFVISIGAVALFLVFALMPAQITSVQSASAQKPQNQREDQGPEPYALRNLSRGQSPDVRNETVDTTSVIVQLKGDPLTTYVKTKPAPGKKIDFNSNTVKSYRAQLSALRRDFKQWLRANAPNAKITGQYDISLNAVTVQLNGTDKSTIEPAPQAQYVEYEGIYYPTSCGTDPDLGLLHAIDAWDVNGGSAHAGEGVRVAIIDSGIDVGHPCFSDTPYDQAPYPPQTQLGDHTFTNNKVIAAKVFNNQAASRGYTAAAVQFHGTHVAGTVGCNYQTPVGDSVVEAAGALIHVSVPIPYCPSGVAPRVLLGNYNVFPADVDDARSEDILNALEAAYADGFDIANMSLGSTPGGTGNLGFQDLLTKAIDNLDQAGFISAVAAGNGGCSCSGGPRHFTVASPGSAARALTAGASSIGHFVGTPLTVDGVTYGALGSFFATVSSDLTAPLGVVLESGDLGFACSALPAGSLSGKIALISHVSISHGGCTFSTQIRNVQNAGAVAALIVKNELGPPDGMGQDGTANQPTIPAYMVSLADKTALFGANGASTTIGATFQYFLSTVNSDYFAEFSSQGPTDVDFRVKPDVIAPGQLVLSSIPLSFCGGASCWVISEGTSMAVPHLAGSAAVVLGQHPGWSAVQVRSAIVNTADATAVKDPFTGESITDVNTIGSGRGNLDSAVSAKVALDPVSVSFGAVPHGRSQTLTYNVTLTNLDSGPHLFSLSVGSTTCPGETTCNGVSYSISPTPISSLAAGATASATVTMTAAKGSSLGGHQAKLTVNIGSTEVAHAAVYALIK